MTSHFTTETVRIAARRPPTPSPEVVAAEVVDEPTAPAAPGDATIAGSAEAIEVEGRDVPDPTAEGRDAPRSIESWMGSSP